MIYYYFVSYVFNNNGAPNFRNIEESLDREIHQREDILEIEKNIAASNNCSWDNVNIINYVLVRVESEVSTL